MKTSEDIADFEEVLKNKPCSMRCCRSMYIDPLDYEKVKSDKGEYCYISVSGGGYYTQWFLYHGLYDKLYYIFRTFVYQNNIGEYWWSWKEFDERDLEI